MSKMMDPRPELGFSGKIWAILLEIGPFCLDLDHMADGWTDFPRVLQDFVPFGAAALLPLNLNHMLLKQGTGTADHLLPLG